MLRRKFVVPELIKYEEKLDQVTMMPPPANGLGSPPEDFAVPEDDA